MKKADLVKKIAEDNGLTIKQTTAIVNSVFEGITAVVQAGDRIQIPDFGTFEYKIRAARTAKNPITGEAIEIPETKVPSFRAAKAFKDIVKG